MTEVYLSHNPFTIDTEIRVDNQRITKGPLWEITHQYDEAAKKEVPRRLQMWLSGLYPALKKATNSTDLSITFRGMESDFEDIRTETEKAASNFDGRIKFTHEPPKPVEHRITELRKLFEEARREGPIEEFREKDLKERFEQSLSSDFEVTVIATMKAGKSTLINAIVGDDLFPSKTESCTATVLKIQDDEGRKEFEGRAYLLNGKLLEDWKPINRDGLNGWNRDDISHIEIRGDIQSVRSEGMRLVLVDTPGPNNSRNEEHSKATFRVIMNRQMPLVVYALNVQQLGVTDDKRLLQQVANEIKAGGKQSQDRFLFAITRMDELDPEKGESVAHFVKIAKEYLSNNGIDNANVIPVSALVTKLIRMHRNNKKLTLKEKGKLSGEMIPLFVESKEMHLLEHSSVSSYVRELIESRLRDAEEKKDEMELALLHSGLPALESAIEEYLHKYAIPAKIKQAVESFQYILSKADKIKKINDELQSNRKDIRIIHDKMQEIEKKMQQGKEADDFRDQIRRQKYEAGSDYKKATRSNKIRCEELCVEIANDMKGKCTPEEAKDKWKMAEQRIRLYRAQIEQQMDEGISAEVDQVAERLRTQYKEYVVKLIGDIQGNPPAFDSFKAAAVKLPPSGNLISQHKYSEQICVGTETVKVGKWYNPFSWGNTETRKIYEEQERVKMDELVGEIVTAVRADMDDFETSAKQQAQNRVDAIKKFFIGEMSKLDEQLRLFVKELGEQTRSEAAMEKAIRANENTIKWLDSFQGRLNEVLSI